MCARHTHCGKQPFLTSIGRLCEWNASFIVEIMVCFSLLVLECIHFNANCSRKLINVIYIYIYIYMYMCMYISMYIYIYIYIYITLKFLCTSWMLLMCIVLVESWIVISCLFQVFFLCFPFFSLFSFPYLFIPLFSIELEESN